MLRRDAPAGSSVFSQSQETINFTFDEFRDYLIAQYLVDQTFATNPDDFQNYIDNANPANCEAIEGIKRYLFYASRDESNVHFFDYYRAQSWYADVYPAEVFNIDTGLQRADDCDAIVGLLKAGGFVAKNVARSLSFRWYTRDNELLNLGLLVSYASQIDDNAFKDLIVGTFKTVRYSNDGAATTDFCRFINSHVLLNLDPT